MRKKQTKEEIRNTLREKIEEEIKNNKREEALKMPEPKANKVNIVSLFCGAGGMDLGVELAGLDAKLGFQKVNKAYKERNSFEKIRNKGLFHHLYSTDMFTEALETYRSHFSSETVVQRANIRKIGRFPSADIVLGGFPCPGFSASGPRLIDDSRNFLYIQYIRVLMETQPKFFIAENVKGMLTLGGGEVFEQIVEDFSASGYKVKHKLVNARDYGVPQLRERVFLVGVREDIDFEYMFPESTHGKKKKDYMTLFEAIGDLEKKPGEFFTGGYSSMYMSRNRKKKWSEQSFTIQASGRQAPLHPSGVNMEKVGKDQWEMPGGEEKHRRLSVKEIARIQTFPDWYEFSDGEKGNVSLNGKMDKKYKQIGNAVPVELARIIARPIAEWFEKSRE